MIEDIGVLDGQIEGLGVTPSNVKMAFKIPQCHWSEPACFDTPWTPFDGRAA